MLQGPAERPRMVEPMPVDGPCEADVYAPVEHLLRVLATRCSARAALLRLLNDSGSTLRLVAAVGVDRKDRTRIDAVTADCGVCGEALFQESLCSSTTSCACVHKLGKETRRVVSLPLSFRRRPCGVLTLFLAEERELSADVHELLPALGEVLGLALENARLMQGELHAALMEERQLLASEVHDSLAQNLASMRMRAALLKGALDKGEVDRAASYVAEIDESASVAQTRVRQIITHFRTGMDAQRLLPALERTIVELNGLGHAQIEFQRPRSEPPLSAFQRLQVFHIAREALTNAVKHARARRVCVELTVLRGRCEVVVDDDGIGVDADRSTDHGHFGLNIMRERTHKLHGTLAYESAPGRGTRVRLCFPIRGVKTRPAR